MRSNKKSLTSLSDREVLKRYLLLYTDSQRGIKVLDKRKRDLERLRKNTLNLIQYGVSCQGGGALKSQLEDVTTKLDSIETQIVTDYNHMLDVRQNIVDIISLLPLDSMERKVLELRYIDGMNFYDIEIELSYVKSRLYVFLNSALDTLLQEERVIDILNGFLKDNT